MFATRNVPSVPPPALLLEDGRGAHSPGRARLVFVRLPWEAAGCPSAPAWGVGGTRALSFSLVPSEASVGRMLVDQLLMDREVTFFVSTERGLGIQSV